jgi:hypothetical protein
MASPPGKRPPVRWEDLSDRKVKRAGFKDLILYPFLSDFFFFFFLGGTGV